MLSRRNRVLFPKLEELAQDGKYADVVRLRSPSVASQPRASQACPELTPPLHSFRLLADVHQDRRRRARGTTRHPCRPAALLLLILLLLLLSFCVNARCALLSTAASPQELAEELDVSALPTIGLFRNGEEIDRSIGNDIDGVVAMLDKAGAVSRGASTGEQTVDGGEPGRGPRASLVRTAAPRQSHHSPRLSPPCSSPHSHVLPIVFSVSAVICMQRGETN